LNINHLLYGISLAALGFAIYFVVQYPETNRLQTIAGVLTAIGFVLNFYSFSNKKA
jgi:arginine/ornithine N-succinyltransferase beta subunit